MLRIENPPIITREIITLKNLMLKRKTIKYFCDKSVDSIFKDLCGILDITFKAVKVGNGITHISMHPLCLI